jgi:hypothetical protein
MKFNRNEYIHKIDEKKYRVVVYKALNDQPTSNFMKANHKAPDNDSLFRFTIKARNQTLMTPFMSRVIFNQGNGLYRLCSKDRQDTTYHMLSVCIKLTGKYTQRHDAVVDRFDESFE